MKTILALCFAVIFSSCSPFFLNTHDYVEKTMPLHQAWPIVASYAYQHEEKDYWKSPVEFVQDGGGDCEDFAAYLVYLLGPESRAIEIHIGANWKPIPNRGAYAEGNHVIVEYRGKYLEPQLLGVYFNKSELNIGRTWTYSDLMFLVTLGGIKGI